MPPQLRRNRDLASTAENINTHKRHTGATVPSSRQNDQLTALPITAQRKTFATSSMRTRHETPSRGLQHQEEDDFEDEQEASEEEQRYTRQTSSSTSNRLTLNQTSHLPPSRALSQLPKFTSTNITLQSNHINSRPKPIEAPKKLIRETAKIKKSKPNGGKKKTKQPTPPPARIELDEPEEGEYDPASGVWIPTPSQVRAPTPQDNPPVKEKVKSKQASGRKQNDGLEHIISNLDLRIQEHSKRSNNRDAIPPASSRRAPRPPIDLTYSPIPRIIGGQYRDTHRSQPEPITSQLDHRLLSKTSIPETQYDQETSSPFREPQAGEIPFPPCGQRMRSPTPEPEHEPNEPLFLPVDDDEQDTGSDSDLEVLASPVQRPTTRRSRSQGLPYILDDLSEGDDEEEPEDDSEEEEEEEEDVYGGEDHRASLRHAGFTGHQSARGVKRRRAEDFVLSNTEPLPNQNAQRSRRTEHRSRPRQAGLRKVKTYVKDSRGVARQRLEPIIPRNPAQQEQFFTPEPDFLADHESRRRDIIRVKQEFAEQARAVRQDSFAQESLEPGQVESSPEEDWQHMVPPATTGVDTRRLARGRRSDGALPQLGSQRLFDGQELYDPDRAARLAYLRPMSERVLPHVDSDLRYHHTDGEYESRTSRKKKKRRSRRYAGTGYTDVERYGGGQLEMGDAAEIGTRVEEYVDKVNERRRSRPSRRDENTIVQIQPKSKPKRKLPHAIPYIPTSILKPIETIPYDEYKEQLKTRHLAGVAATTAGAGPKVNTLICAGHKAKHEDYFKVPSRSRARTARTATYQIVNRGQFMPHWQSQIENQGIPDDISVFTQVPPVEDNAGYLAKRMTRDGFRVPPPRHPRQRLPFTASTPVDNAALITRRPRQELPMARLQDTYGNEDEILSNHQPARSPSFAEPAIDIPGLAGPKAVSFIEAHRARLEAEAVQRKAAGQAPAGQIGFRQRLAMKKRGEVPPTNARDSSTRDQQGHSDPQVPEVVPDIPHEPPSQSALPLPSLSPRPGLAASQPIPPTQPRHIRASQQGTQPLTQLLQQVNEDSVDDLQQWMDENEQSRGSSAHLQPALESGPHQGGLAPQHDQGRQQSTQQDQINEWPAGSFIQSQIQADHLDIPDPRMTEDDDSARLQQALRILDDPNFDPAAVGFSGLQLCDELIRNSHAFRIPGLSDQIRDRETPQVQAQGRGQNGIPPTKVDQVEEVEPASESNAGIDPDAKDGQSAGVGDKRKAKRADMERRVKQRRDTEPDSEGNGMKQVGPRRTSLHFTRQDDVDRELGTGIEGEEEHPNPHQINRREAFGLAGSGIDVAGPPREEACSEETADISTRSERPVASAKSSRKSSTNRSSTSRRQSVAQLSPTQIGSTQYPPSSSSNIDPPSSPPPITPWSSSPPAAIDREPLAPAQKRESWQQIMEQLARGERAPLHSQQQQQDSQARVARHDHGSGSSRLTVDLQCRRSGQERQADIGSRQQDYKSVNNVKYHGDTNPTMLDSNEHDMHIVQTKESARRHSQDMDQSRPAQSQSTYTKPPASPTPIPKSHPRDTSTRQNQAVPTRHPSSRSKAPLGIRRASNQAGAAKQFVRPSSSNPNWDPYQRTAEESQPSIMVPHRDAVNTINTATTKRRTSKSQHNGQRYLLGEGRLTSDEEGSSKQAPNLTNTHQELRPNTAQHQAKDHSGSSQAIQRDAVSTQPLYQPPALCDVTRPSQTEDLFADTETRLNRDGNRNSNSKGTGTGNGNRNSSTAQPSRTGGRAGMTRLIVNGNRSQNQYVASSVTSIGAGGAIRPARDFRVAAGKRY